MTGKVQIGERKQDPEGGSIIWAVCGKLGQVILILGAGDGTSPNSAPAHPLCTKLLIISI